MTTTVAKFKKSDLQQYLGEDGRYNLKQMIAASNGSSDSALTMLSCLRSNFPNAKLECHESRGSFIEDNEVNGFYLYTPSDYNRVGLSLRNVHGGSTPIASGDENIENLPSNLPRMSFKILASLVARKNMTGEGSDVEQAAMDYVLKNRSRITVIDYTGDEWVSKPHNYAGKIGTEKYNRLAQHPMHKQGYSLAMKGNKYQWHRPSTFVVAYSGRYFVLGQDENQYFGSELPKGSEPRTIAEAFDALKPEAVRSYSGKVAVLRQGEWFAVPVPEKQVPKAVDCYVLDSGVVLPREDESSARHEVTAVEDICVGPDGRIYAKEFRMEHSEGDHANLHGESGQWYTFYRNTSVANYSDKGMD